MPSVHDLVLIVCIGAGATAVMDGWLLVLQRLGVPVSNFALVGRWIGHMARGRFAHAAIGKAAAAPREHAIGWLTHYAVGIAFAGVLVAAQGAEWPRQPSLLPAVATGLATVVLPLFVMQPAMGSGFAASKTPAPLKNCLKSVANHAVFGVGLYLCAAVLVLVMR
ncbi:MAG TPA: DUF2938 domain-containing protein [Burkholderiaceae bacterium]|nr:DUF2938 domain-containing protein [Burkholderiaceae bacterium]